jgi:hypothetical protein
MIAFTDKTIRHGANRWCVTGVIAPGEVTLTRIEGDVTKPAELRAAVRTMLCSRLKYQRVARL